MDIIVTVLRTSARRGQNNKNRAKGHDAVGICERSGFKHKLNQLTMEPGTGYLVHKTESDETHNLVTDPLNYPPEKLNRPEGKLRYTSPEVPLSIGTVVSPTSLALTGDIMVDSFYDYPETL